MRGSRGLSLRTRLLLLQLAVTAVFLLVLGIVSTDLFAHNFTDQFDQIILDESTRSTADIQERPAPQLEAVLVTLSPFLVQPLPTGSKGPRRSSRQAIRSLGQARVYALARHDKPFQVSPTDGHDFHLTAAARVIPATENFPRRSSVLVVAERQNELTSPLRGLIGQRSSPLAA